MKNSKKKLVSRAGFTLVELVVTIAVLAILAGVGATAYGGYITKAKEAKDVAKLANVLTAAQAATAADAEGETVYSISIAPTSGDITVKYGENGKNTLDLNKTFKTVYGSTTCVLDSESYSTGANWTAAKGKWGAGA